MEEALRVSTELPPHPKASGCNATEEGTKLQLMNKQSKHSNVFHHVFLFSNFTPLSRS